MNKILRTNMGHANGPKATEEVLGDYGGLEGMMDSFQSFCERDSAAMINFRRKI